MHGAKATSGRGRPLLHCSVMMKRGPRWILGTNVSQTMRYVQHSHVIRIGKLTPFVGLSQGHCRAAVDHLCIITMPSLIQSPLAVYDDDDEASPLVPWNLWFTKLNHGSTPGRRRRRERGPGVSLCTNNIAHSKTRLRETKRTYPS